MYFVKGFKVFPILIAVPGLINLDFADVKTIMSNKGSALNGDRDVDWGKSGSGSGEKSHFKSIARNINRRRERCPHEYYRRFKLSLFEVQEAADIVASASDEDVNMIFGSVINDNLKDEIIVTVIATGFTEEQLSPARPARSARFRCKPSTDARTGSTSNTTISPTRERREEAPQFQQQEPAPQRVNNRQPAG